MHDFLVDTIRYIICAYFHLSICLTFEAPTPQNGQTHSIRWQQPTNCLSVFDHFVGMVLKGLTLGSANDSEYFQKRHWKAKPAKTYREPCRTSIMEVFWSKY